MRKTSDKPGLGDMPQDLASAPQDCQGHEKQGKTKKLSQTRENWGHVTTDAVWYSELDPGAKSAR